MKNTFFAVLLFLGIPLAGSAGAEPAGLERNLETARWMLAYDHVAWVTSDLLVKEGKETLRKVGPVWFCAVVDGRWHAFYGSEHDRRFEVVACYRQAAESGFAKVSSPDFPDRDRFARAIGLTLPAILETTRRTTVRFNYFVRAEGDGIAVYYLPGLQPDGKFAYGIEHTYLVDRTGGRIVAHIQHGDVLIGRIPNRQRVVSLELPDCDVPTPQALFTMLSCRDQFGDIQTVCRNGTFGTSEEQGALTCVRRSL